MQAFLLLKPLTQIINSDKYIASDGSKKSSTLAVTSLMEIIFW